MHPSEQRDDEHTVRYVLSPSNYTSYRSRSIHNNCPVYLDQWQFARYNSTILERSRMSSRQITINGIISIQPRKNLERESNQHNNLSGRHSHTYRRSARRVGPTLHEIADNVKQGHDIDAGLSHAIVADVADQWGGGARGFDIGPDAVALFAKGKGEESRA